MSLQTDLRIPTPEVPLHSYSTFKIGGRARFLGEPRTPEELFALLEFRRQEGLPLLVIGRGSNLLFSDDGYPGLVLLLRKFQWRPIALEGDCLLRVPSGLGLYSLCCYCQSHSLGGAEFLCHIPGTVGGAVVMNAGFGRPENGWHQIEDILQSVTLLEGGGRIREIESRELGLQYRKSNLDRETVVLDALLQLKPKPGGEIARQIRANFDYRDSVQDLRYPSAGSIFKNPKPDSLSAGQLLERVGMKGMRIGGAMVSEKHANFFLNVAGATARQVRALMAIASRRVFEELGVLLEPEIQWIPSGSDEDLDPLPL